MIFSVSPTGKLLFYSKITLKWIFVGGKGGVGKSMVTSLLASKFMQMGKRVAILDADITGPSIPKAFGIEGERIAATEDGLLMFPSETKNGIEIMSANLLLENSTDPIVWRGALIATAVKQFYEETIWQDIDYMFVDMPPGTGDIHISLLQDVPVNGAVIVTTPQDVALADVEKGVNMFQNPSIGKPILGLVENMAWFTPEELPENRYYIFGKDGGARMAEKLGITLLGQIPIVQSIRESGDSGEPAALGSRPDSLAFLDLARAVDAEASKIQD